MSNEQIINELETLYTAVVCDILDELGHPNQTLPSDVRPLTSYNKVCGTVFPVRAIAVQKPPPEPYKLEIQALETMQKGDVLIMDAGHNRQCGIWGELFTTACLYKGVRGVVMTACTRDMWKVKDMAFPIFGIGYYSADSKGRADVVEIKCPIKIGQVTIAYGDYVLGDEDGVVIIPQNIVSDVIRAARQKVSGESTVRADLVNGVSLSEVFKKYGIL